MVERCAVHGKIEYKNILILSNIRFGFSPERTYTMKRPALPDRADPELSCLSSLGYDAQGFRNLLITICNNRSVG